ncbi:hypothetical protein IFM89_022928, partial [Coptis chinensis]
PTSGCLHIEWLTRDTSSQWKIQETGPKPTPKQLYNPPSHTRGIRRPRKNRRRDEDEEAPNKKRRKCRLCRTEGHNSKTCKGLPAQPKGKDTHQYVVTYDMSGITYMSGIIILMG